MPDQSVPIAIEPVESSVPAGDAAPDHDSSICLTELLHDARTKQVEVFERLHGRGFLVRWVHDGAFDSPAPLGSSSWRKNTVAYPAQRSKTVPVLTSMAPEAFFIYRLPFHQRETLRVGRAHTADVCVGDMSVLTMHAELEWCPEGKLKVTDRGSTNGTRVARQWLDCGETATLGFGKTLIFGTVRLTYMPVNQFIDLVALVTSDHPIELE